MAKKKDEKKKKKGGIGSLFRRLIPGQLQKDVFGDVSDKLKNRRK